MSDLQIQSPFIIRVDSREQTPFTFENIRAGADQDNALIEVRSVVGTLASGDYSIEGMQDRVAVERKSLSDLYGSLTAGRDRFVRELDRLAEMDFAAVVTEASWHDIATGPEHATRVNSRSIVGSILAFIERYPIAWVTAGSRPFAAALTYRLLERFWLDDRDGKRPIRSNQFAEVA